MHETGHSDLYTGPTGMGGMRRDGRDGEGWDEEG